MTELGLTQQEESSLSYGLYNIIFTNDVCCSYIYDLIEVIIKAGIYKKDIKYRGNILKAHLKDYNRLLDKVYNYKDVVACMNEELEDTIQSDLAKLEYSTKNYMHKCHVPYTDVQCKSAIAYVFAQGACHNVDENIKRRPTISKYANKYEALKITKISDALERLMEELEKVYNQGHYFCDLNQNNDIFNGFVVICRKLADPDIIYKIVKKYDK
jgi:hypothetical protein